MAWGTERVYKRVKGGHELEAWGREGLPVAPAEIGVPEPGLPVAAHVGAPQRLVGFPLPPGTAPPGEGVFIQTPDSRAAEDWQPLDGHLCCPQAAPWPHPNSEGVSTWSCDPGDTFTGHACPLLAVGGVLFVQISCLLWEAPLPAPNFGAAGPGACWHTGVEVSQGPDPRFKLGIPKCRLCATWKPLPDTQ